MNRERVQKLRNVIAGIPEKNIRLDDIFQGDEIHESNPPKPCGAIACIAGWAWIYPPFVKAGIRKYDCSAWHAAAEFFDVPFGTFDQRGREERGTDKEIALRRLDKLLEA